MDDVVNRLAKELSAAIAVAAAEDPKVQEVHQKARAAGYRMEVKLEALIGFGNYVTRPRKNVEALAIRTPAAVEVCELSANDKRFLRSVRIAVEEDREIE